MILARVSAAFAAAARRSRAPAPESWGVAWAATDAAARSAAAWACAGWVSPTASSAEGGTAGEGGGAAGETSRVEGPSAKAESEAWAVASAAAAVVGVASDAAAPSMMVDED